MDAEKAKVAQDREQIEAEVRRIRELNLQLQQQLAQGSSHVNPLSGGSPLRS
jgi:hypothetical protein